MSSNLDDLLKSFWPLADKGIQNYLIPFLEGEAGESKTFTWKKMAKDLGVPILIYNLSAMDATDLTGYPYEENGVQKYATPEMFTLERGIIFFDELNRISNEDVKTALLSLFVDKAVNGHKLSPNVLLVSAGNPPTDDYSTKPLDRAFEDRIIKIPFSRSYDEFLDYMFENHDVNDLLKFYFSSPQVFNSKVNKGKSRFSKRRLEYAYNLYTHGGKNAAILSHALSPEVYSGFLEFQKKNLATWGDLKAGRIQIDKNGIPLDAVTNRVLTVDFIEELRKYPTYDEITAKRINNFLHQLNGQTRDFFITNLAGIMKDPQWNKVKPNYMEMKLFSGYMEYVNTVLNGVK